MKNRQKKTAKKQYWFWNSPLHMVRVRQLLLNYFIPIIIYALQTCLLIEPLSFWDCRGSFKHSGGDGRSRKAQ